MAFRYRNSVLQLQFDCFPAALFPFLHVSIHDELHRRVSLVFRVLPKEILHRLVFVSTSRHENELLALLPVELEVNRLTCLVHALRFQRYILCQPLFGKGDIGRLDEKVCDASLFHTLSPFLPLLDEPRYAVSIVLLKDSLGVFQMNFILDGDYKMAG